jgi:hypothetical protein
MAGNIVDIIKYTSGIVNSISGSGTTNELAYFTASTTIASLTTATYPSLTELSYVKGVTSSIQTQLNGKQAAGTYVTSVTGTSPIVSSGGTTPAISIPVATTSVNGYLSSTDWTTFNSKQNALTNPVTGTGTTNYVPKFTGSTTIGNSNLINDANGNLGLGVTPSAWFSGSVAFQLGATGSLSARNAGVETVGLSSNAILNTSGSWQYIISEEASLYETFGGQHIWRNAPLGTAGNAITFSQPMTLFASGNLAVGTPTDAGFKLDVNGTGRFTGNVGIGGITSTNRLQVLASNTGTQITTIPVAKFVNTGNAFSKFIIGSDNANYDAVISMDNNATLANTKLRFYIGNGESSTAGHSNDQIVLQGNGNVGIGTASPTSTFDITGASAGAITQTIRNTQAGVGAGSGFRMGNNLAVNRLEIFTLSSTYTTAGAYVSDGSSITNEGTGGLSIGATNAAGVLRFYTAGTGTANERMTITSGGNVLIGTTTDNGAKFQVNGTGRFSSSVTAEAVGGGGHVVTYGNVAPALNTTATLASGVSYGIIAIYETTNTGQGCILLMAAGVLTLVSNPSGNYTTTVDTASKWNITVSGGVISIQNKRANGDSFQATINRLV